MLYDPDRPKISETAQHQIEETRIEKITALTVTKFGTGQFSQRGRKITPGIGISNWIQRQLKALPNRPGKDECDRRSEERRVGKERRTRRTRDGRRNKDTR